MKKRNGAQQEVDVVQHKLKVILHATMVRMGGVGHITNPPWRRSTQLQSPFSSSRKRPGM